MEQARVAMGHAFTIGHKCRSTLLPTGIYTIPEASMVGLTEQAVIQSGEPYIVGIAPYSDNARGRLIGDQDGMLKLIFRKSDQKLIGVHAVGEQATELVHIGLVVMLMNGGMEVFDRACFNYPTLGDLYKFATYAALGKKLKESLSLQDDISPEVRHS
jgi:NAD(P) transhydrogenase